MRIEENSIPFCRASTIARLFWMFVNQLFTYLTCPYVRCFNVKFSTYYFHMKTKLLADFQICISVPLTSEKKQNWLQKTLSHLAELAHLCVFIWKIFISPWWDPGKIKRDPTWVGWLTSHMNTLSIVLNLYSVSINEILVTEFWLWELQRI